MHVTSATRKSFGIKKPALDYDIGSRTGDADFSSPNLKNRTYGDSFGEGQGAHGGVWECPDLFELPVEGTNEKEVGVTL